MGKFVITGLPRSRSAWFSAYLSNGNVRCYHEAFYNRIALNGYEHVGTADCGYLLVPDLVKALGEHKLVIIHRDPKDVAESVAAVGLPDEIGFLPELAEMLEKLSGLHIGYNDIDERLEEMHEYLDIPYDAVRAEQFKQLNIQAMEWSR